MKPHEIKEKIRTLSVNLDMKDVFGNEVVAIKDAEYLLAMNMGHIDGDRRTIELNVVKEN